MDDREKTVYVINRKYGRHFAKIAVLTVFILALCAGLFFAGIYVTAEDIRSDAAKASRLLTEEASRQGAGIIVTSIGKHLELEYDEIYKL